MSMCMPIVATSTYKAADPIRDAPTPSSLRARVKLKANPIVVEITTTQKNPEVRL